MRWSMHSGRCVGLGDLRSVAAGGGVHPRRGEDRVGGDIRGGGDVAADHGQHEVHREWNRHQHHPRDTRDRPRVLCGIRDLPGADGRLGQGGACGRHRIGPERVTVES